MARVLVVEDEDSTRLLLESCLRRAGHRVRAVASASEARAVVARAGVPEVLVTDLFMPGGNGLSLVASLRAVPACADLPVILISGRALPGDIEAGRGLRAAAYLAKPVSLVSLTEAVGAALQVAPAVLETSVRERLAELGNLEVEEDRELFAQLLTSFTRNAPTSLTAVERAVAAQDAEAVEAAAHRFGGSAANLGAASLARLCVTLEVDAAQGRLPERATCLVLRREVALACRVLGVLALELAPGHADGYA